MIRSVALVLIGILTVLTYAVGEPCPLDIGTNISGPRDWGSEWPFVNIMKYSRSWITHNSVWVPGGENEWDTGLLEHIPVDEHGYPLSLPYTVAGAETTQVVRTVWANTGELKQGTYVVLYEGQGVLDVWGDGSIVDQSPGRMEIEVTPGIDEIMALELLQSQEGDHVRSIRVLLPGTEGTHQVDPWSQEWLEKLEPFQTLRFMDWGSTNNSRLIHWDDRPQLDDYTYTIDGIPYEWMIEICNAKEADAWICVPHAADENYIREMARLFRDDLDPSLKIYVEYSNEIWNWMFDQAHYCYENGDQEVPWPERVAPFIQNCLDIWSEEFAGQLHRLVRVVGVQHSWQDVSNRIVFNMVPGSFDAFSPAAYFGFSEAGYAALDSLGESATAEDALYWAREGMLVNSYPWTRSQKESIADVLDIPMIYYEGGQHMTPNPFGSEQPYNQALMDAQTHSQMYDLYDEWLDSLRTFVPAGESVLFANFSFISPKSGKYGSWGALESQFHQAPPYEEIAPKYQALLDNLCEASGITQDVYMDGIAPRLTYRNPLHFPTRLGFSLSEAAGVRLLVFDARGRRVAKLVDGTMPAGRHAINWNPSDLAGGVYFLRLETGGTSWVGKGLRVR